MDTIIDSFSILSNKSILEYLAQGIVFTLIISIIANGIGIILGSILALVRNYCKSNKSFFSKIITGFFRSISIAYIEIFRNTPLLLWIFVSVVFFPFPEALSKPMFGLSSVEMKLLFKGAAALVLFTSSVIAEIVRGGLNSVPEGQFEAGYSQGFNTVQVMIYIIFPQAYRNIVPTLLSQVVTTIKDSSYLANIAVIELMSRINTVLNSAHRYNGNGNINVSDVFVLLGLAMVIYFIINFILSSCVRRMQKRMSTPKGVAPTTTA